MSRPGTVARLMNMAAVLSASAFCAEASSPESRDPDCPDLLNLQACNGRHESSVLKTHPGLIWRSNGKTFVRLDDGQSRSIDDPAKYFDLVAVHESSRMAVLREQYYEGNGWHVLHLGSGELTAIGGYPVFSPSGKYFFAVEQAGEAEYNQSLAAIFRVKGDRAHLAWNAPCKATTAWDPFGPVWSSDAAVTFEQERIVPSMIKVRMRQAEVRLVAGSWKATGLQCEKQRTPTAPSG